MNKLADMICFIFGGHKWISLYNGYECKMRYCKCCDKQQVNYGYKWENRR